MYVQVARITSQRVSEAKARRTFLNIFRRLPKTFDEVLKMF